MDRIIQASEQEFLSLVKQAVREVMQDYQPTANNSNRPPANKKEAAAYLHMSVSTLDKILKSGQLLSFNVGRQVRIRWDDLESYGNKKSA